MINGSTLKSGSSRVILQLKWPQEEKRENCKLKRQRERDLKIEKKCERKKEVMKGNRERERLCKKERYIEWNEEKHTEN